MLLLLRHSVGTETNTASGRKSKLKIEIDIKKRIGSCEAECIQSKAPARKPPFSRQRHRHGKKRTESASIAVEEGGDE
jgi:hypothetical protein